MPETQPVDDLLRQLQARRASLAVVLDEYGDFAGVVTVEDVIEEIVGEIDDERDRAPAVDQQPDGRLWCAATCPWRTCATTAWSWWTTPSPASAAWCSPGWAACRAPATR